MGEPRETAKAKLPDEGELPGETEVPVLSASTRRSATLVAIFLRHVPIELGNLESAIQSKDDRQIKHVAHKLKGSCCAVGVMRMAALCDDLERTSARVSDAPPKHARLVVEYERASTRPHRADPAIRVRHFYRAGLFARPRPIALARAMALWTSSWVSRPTTL
jgi:HPt (histidine-containing phosphotransfer) domain-containing protein